MHHYNLWGQQHHRNPFKDKSGHYNAPTDSRWHRKPMYGSRTELQQARKQWRVPDKTFDVDGDGVVGQRDYFIGKSFDANHNDVLGGNEVHDVAKNLNQGWMDRFQFGHDRVGTKKPVETKQVRGVIVTSDDFTGLSESYPKHHNAHNNPPHSTKTELELDRKALAKAVNADIMDKWCLQHPIYVKEDLPRRERDHVDAAASHIRERAEADHQLARVRGGLLPYTYPVNPEREEKYPGLSYVANPSFKTRSQLLETRKELNKEDCDRLRMVGEQDFVPHSVRGAEQESACFEYRRAGPEPMTMTKLKNARKQDRIEYDMANFNEEKRQFPRFSDQPHPFWTMGNDRSPHEKKPRMHKTVSEPVIKVTDAPSAFETKVEVGPIVGPVQPLTTEVLQEPLPRPQDQAADMFTGTQTKKRYTDFMIETGQMRNQPRYFDNLQPLRTDKNDYLPLDHWSSFEMIRDASYASIAKSTSKDSPLISKLHSHTPKLPPGVPKSNHSASGTSSTGPERPSPAPRSIAAESGTSSVNPQSHVDGSHIGKGTPSPVRKVERLPTREAPNYVSGSPSPAKNGGYTGVRCGGFQRYDQQQRPEFQYLQNHPRTRTDSTAKSIGALSAAVSAVGALKRGGRSRTQTAHSAHSS